MNTLMLIALTYVGMRNKKNNLLLIQLIKNIKIYYRIKAYSDSQMQ